MRKPVYLNSEKSNNLIRNTLSTTPIRRREFLGGAFAATAAVSSMGVLSSFAADSAPSPTSRKIKLGLVGCGGRGSWISNLFQKSGGYEMHAVADYFQANADKCGGNLGVDSSRRFSTLSGYKRVMESGVEAVALIVPPYFFPEHARAAVEAGLHVYMAKPVAVDVPGAMAIQEAAQLATQKQKCFFVDYQLPTDPSNIEVFKRIATPGFGKVTQLETTGIGGGFSDPPRTANLESRLQKLIWVNDIALGCDYLGNYDIHAIDAALWVAGARPISANGASRICRPNPHGDSHDVCSIVFEYANGIAHNHVGSALKNYLQEELSCRVYGQTGNAMLSYWSQAQFRSYDDGFKGNVENLYEAGVVRNIAAFHKIVTGGQFENETVKRAVDGVLACTLGREAASRGQKLTMDAITRENKKLEVDLSGLKT